MAYKRKSPEERIAEDEKRLAQIQARISRDKAKLREAERKADTRRKIIAGALALEHQDAEFQETLRRLLHEYVKPQDRHLFDLPPLPEKPETPPE